MPPEGQSSQTPAEPPAPEIAPQTPLPSRKTHHGSPMTLIWIIAMVIFAGLAAFGAYSWQQTRVTSLKKEVTTLQNAAETKKQQEEAANSDDTVVLARAKDYCEGQLSLDSKQPRKFTANTVNGKQVRYGGDKQFAQVKVDCRDVSNTDPLAQVPYILKKTNDHWYVVQASAEGDPEPAALFGVPSTFDE